MARNMQSNMFKTVISSLLWQIYDLFQASHDETRLLPERWRLEFCFENMHAGTLFSKPGSFSKTSPCVFIPVGVLHDDSQI